MEVVDSIFNGSVASIKIGNHEIRLLTSSGRGIGISNLGITTGILVNVGET